MATAPVMVKNETAFIAIDKLNHMCTIDVTSGTKDAVTFHADEDCVLHFENPAVFGREYLPLKRDEAQAQSVVSLNQTTRFDVFVPLTVVPPTVTATTVVRGTVMPASRIWPIVP